MLVVNEPELAEAIGRLRGEWAERSGGELSAAATTWSELAAAKAIDGDVIVFPSRYLGELCVRDWLRPVRANVLESDELDVSGIYPLVRQELIRWGGQVMALPLGVELGRSQVMILLSRAAPMAMSKERIGMLFDSETMEPRIAEPPFVDALSQLVSTREESGVARADRPQTIPVLGYSDRLAAVTSSTHNAARAFKLLEWLAAADTSSQLAQAGGGAMPVRPSLATSQAWYDASLSPSERADLGKQVEAALSSEQYLVIPRIPGVDEYMTALDQAMNDALLNGVAPQAALKKAASRWEEITDAHGRDLQRQAYLKHLGISEP